MQSRAGERVGGGVGSGVGWGRGEEVGVASPARGSEKVRRVGSWGRKKARMKNHHPPVVSRASIRLLRSYILCTTASRLLRPRQHL